MVPGFEDTYDNKFVIFKEVFFKSFYKKTSSSYNLFVLEYNGLIYEKKNSIFHYSNKLKIINTILTY